MRGRRFVERERRSKREALIQAGRRVEQATADAKADAARRARLHREYAEAMSPTHPHGFEPWHPTTETEQ